MNWRKTKLYKTLFPGSFRENLINEALIKKIIKGSEQKEALYLLRKGIPYSVIITSYLDSQDLPVSLSQYVTVYTTCKEREMAKKTVVSMIRSGIEIPKTI